MTLHARPIKNGQTSPACRAAENERPTLRSATNRRDFSRAGRVIHVASSHRMGLTAQETELALAYKNLNAFDLLVVTGENEQVAGSFRRLSEHGVRNAIIPGFDEHRDFSRLVRQFAEQCTAFEPQVVTVNTNWQLLVAGVARHFCKSQFNILYTVHGFRNNQKLKSYVARFLIGALLFLFADTINAPTSYVAKKFRALRRKIVSIPLGEDPLFFMESKQIQSDLTLRMVFPGQFREGKNQDLLIYALRDYIDQTGDRDVALYLPGSGELLPAAQELASTLGLSEFVIFPGQLNRNEILDLYNKCQIAVVPANSETFGHCIAEPLVLQRILITRRVGIAIDVIKDGENGFLFESKDDLVTRLKQIRATSFSDLSEISRKAGETGRLFRWENIASRHYKEIFNNFSQVDL